MDDAALFGASPDGSACSRRRHSHGHRQHRDANGREATVYESERRHRKNSTAAAAGRAHSSSAQSMSSEGSTRSARSSGSAGSRSRRHRASEDGESPLNLPLDGELRPLPCEEEPGDEAAARDQRRHEVLCMMFDLPETTTFYQDFSCAIAASLAMHGRMYPTSAHVCFYSNVFGRERKILIPYENISELAKTTTMVFQNAIRIKTDAQDEYTFTSFWGNNRDNCFDLILKTRERVLKELRPSVVSGIKRIAGASPPSRSASDGSEIDTATEASTSPRSASSPTSPTANVKANDSRDTATEETTPTTTGEETAPPAPTAPERETSTGGSNEEEPGSADSAEKTARPMRSRRRSFVSDVESIAPKDISMTPILDETFPLTVDEFMAMFFLDNAPFGMDVYGKRTGSTEMTVNPWMTPLEDDTSFGMSRSLQFRVPVEAPIGPKSSRVDVLQCLKKERSVRVVEGSTRLVDIPYGDYFSVEDRWTIVPCPDDASACKVSIELKVVFGKSTFWKSTIEGRAISDNKQKWTDWVCMAKEFIASRKSQEGDACGNEADLPTEPARDAPSTDQPARREPSTLPASRRRPSRSLSVGQDRPKPPHRSRSGSRSAVMPMRTRNVQVKVFPWILVLVLLFIVVRLQATLSTIEQSLEVTSTRVFEMQRQLNQLHAACSTNIQ